MNTILSTLQKYKSHIESQGYYVYKKYKYIPLIKFRGHTECLSYFSLKELP